MFVNDVPNVVKDSRVNLYADDTCITPVSELKNTLEAEIEAVAAWIVDKLWMNVTRHRLCS